MINIDFNLVKEFVLKVTTICELKSTPEQDWASFSASPYRSQIDAMPSHPALGRVAP